jgi:hypothetical protein
MVGECVSTVRRMVDALVPRSYRAAVLSRPTLAWRFPLRVVAHWSTTTEALIAATLDDAILVEGSVSIPDAAGLVAPVKGSRGFVEEPERGRSEMHFMPASKLWPDAVGLPDIEAALHATGHPYARMVGALVHGLALDPDWRSLLTQEMNVAQSDEAARAMFAWHPLAVAHVLDALRAVRDGQRAARHIPLPASQIARVPFEMMSRAETFASKELQRVQETTPSSKALTPATRGGFRVVWDGKPRGEQLSLGFALRGVVQVHIFRDIVRELKAEGLRDYVILHRMAAEHGRTGAFRWTWEDHRRATMHERRVATSSTRDPEAMVETVRRIWRLASAELHMEVEQGGRRAWRVVGEAPLVYVTGGVEYGGHIEGLELRLNPVLYKGARAGRDGDDFTRYFTQLPEAVLRLPSLPFCLAVMLGFRFRYARDQGGVVELTSEELHAYMDAAQWRAGNRTAAAGTLRRALDAVARTMGEGCRWEAVGEDHFRITPPHAWVDAVVHEVPPELPPSQRTAPRTGGELAAWRGRYGLSQGMAAKLLHVGVATLKRAEGRPTETLPRSFRATDWSAAEQLATESPPDRIS